MENTPGPKLTDAPHDSVASPSDRTPVEFEASADQYGLGQSGSQRLRRSRSGIRHGHGSVGHPPPEE